MLFRIVRDFLCCSVVFVWLCTNHTLANTPTPTPTKPAKTTAPTQASKPTVAPAPTVQKVQTWKYDIEFRGSKVGQMKQTETTYSNGKMVVEMQSESTIRILFSTSKNKTRSRTTYWRGQFRSLTMSGIQRSKPIAVQAQRTTNGIKIILTKNKKTTETFHPVSSFQATSADLHFPLHKAGHKNKRRLLRLDEQKVVEQRVRYGKIISQTWKGRKLQLQQVAVQGPQGKADMLFTPKGRMFQMEARLSIFGSLRIVLRDRR